MLGLIVGHGARLALIGIVCGVAGAFGVTRVISTLLYNVTATDPLSFIGTAISLAVIAVLASLRLRPARDGGRSDDRTPLGIASQDKEDPGRLLPQSARSASLA